MEQNKIPYEKQIFVCTNDKKGEAPSCGDKNGEEIFRQLRQIAKDRGLHPRIRVAQAKCLGQCTLGCNVMVYSRGSEEISDVGTASDGVWHKGVTVNDVPDLAKKYLPVPIS